ncbi:hypothetical protein E4U48_008072 [Claviceps purpurea]|nr:hypothetical protein E4U48_008072 [Claviceps purpurea]
MAKYAVLGEKPAKWFFQRASAPPTMTVDALEDNLHDQKCTGPSREQIGLTNHTEFYKNFAGPGKNESTVPKEFTEGWLSIMFKNKSEPLHNGKFARHATPSPMDGQSEKIPSRERLSTPMEKVYDTFIECLQSRRSVTGSCVGNPLPRPSRRV